MPHPINGIKSVKAAKRAIVNENLIFKRRKPDEKMMNEIKVRINKALKTCLKIVKEISLN